MKHIKSVILLSIIFQLILVGQTNNTKKDIYKNDIIKISKSKLSTNEQIEMDIYVKDFSIDKVKKVCEFYKQFYIDEAKKLNNKLTITISVWSKKLSANDIINNPPATNQKQFFQSAKWKKYLELEDKYLHGGIIYNYNNGVYKEDIY